MKIPDIIKSKKFQALIIGLVIVIVADILGITIEAIYSMVGLIGSYEIAQGIADKGKEVEKLKQQ